MTLSADAFICRFPLHVLPNGFHRIRHYGLFASGQRAANIARIRSLLAAPPRSQAEPASGDPPALACSCCGGRLVVIERFRRGEAAQACPSVAVRIDTS
jgi:hypothetical protein